MYCRLPIPANPSLEKGQGYCQTKSIYRNYLLVSCQMFLLNEPPSCWMATNEHALFHLTRPSKRYSYI